MSERMTFFYTLGSAVYGPRVFLFNVAEIVDHDAFNLAKLLCKWKGPDQRWGDYIGYEFSAVAFFAMKEWLRSHGYIEVSAPNEGA